MVRAIYQENKQIRMRKKNSIIHMSKTHQYFHAGLSLGDQAHPENKTKKHLMSASKAIML